jgi:limonene-1,2-epoxide hydrolase
MDDEGLGAGIAAETPKRLTVETVRELWSRTYNSAGKPDWSHLYPLYHPDIVFKDSIQEIRGKDEFIALCERLTERCEQLRMDIHSIVEGAGVFHLEWTMTMVFKKFPSTPIYGSTVLRLHEDGRIASQRDYYDLWGDIFNGIPWFRKPYRRFMRKKFG